MLAHVPYVTEYLQLIPGSHLPIGMYDIIPHMANITEQTARDTTLIDPERARQSISGVFFPKLVNQYEKSFCSYMLELTTITERI